MITLPWMTTGRFIRKAVNVYNSAGMRLYFHHLFQSEMLFFLRYCIVCLLNSHSVMCHIYLTCLMSSTSIDSIVGDWSFLLVTLTTGYSSNLPLSFIDTVAFIFATQTCSLPTKGCCDSFTP